MEAQKLIVIADPDVEHIKSYEEDFVFSFRNRAMIQIITEIGALEKFFRIHRDIDVLIIAKEFYGVYLKEHNISHIMFINEKHSVASQGSAAFNILKYRSKEEIFSFVEKSLESEGEQEEFREPDILNEKPLPKVISVYSPIGGCGKSLVSLALARKLKKLGEAVVVIGCDDLQSFSIFLETRQNADTELALRLQEISDDTYWSVLKNLYQDDEISCILPFEKSLTELCIGSEQLFDLINLLKEKCDFSFVILDIGSAFDKKAQTMISISDACVLITESRLTSCRMFEKFRMNMECLSVQNSYVIANQYRTDGFKLDKESLFGFFAGYETAKEAMDDPLFYRLALEFI